MERFKTLMVENDGKSFKITFNRPEKKNAMSLDMWKEVISALDEAAKADTFFTVFTGKGDYFCSGVDLSNVLIGQMPDRSEEDKSLLKRFVAAFIDHPKPLVALVNGPAIGIAVTILALFDLVYASDVATFHTPFGRLGLAPEGCSTVTFPMLMGLSRATDVLLFGRKLTAETALRYGLVTEVFPSAKFATETRARLETASQLPKENILQSRKLIRSQVNEELHRVNEAECKLAEKHRQSKAVLDAAKKFLARSKI